jgi:ubiquitin C-terminal hydrolase
MRSPTGSSVFDPSSFHSSVRHATRKFLSYSQEDSHDLILSILDSCIEQEKSAIFSKEERRKLHTFLKTRIGSTIAFYLVGQVICNECKSENWVFDPCLDLTLPLKYSELEERIDTETSETTTLVELPEGTTRKSAKQSILYKHNRGLGDKELTCVQDYIQQFLAQEKLYDKSNMFHCPKCKKDVKSMHEFYLLDPPDCLFVTLKRFKRDGFYVTKYSKQVENNLVIDLTDYIIQTDPNHVEECKYQLVGYTSHGGSLCGGHYTANVCNNGKYLLN